MRLLAYVYSLAWCTPALGNVEKVIFLGPEPVDIHNPQLQPNIDSLRLEVLSPLNTTIRRQVAATFPSPTLPKGTETWFLLDRLRLQQRYEVRICWAATVRLFASHLLQLSVSVPNLIHGKHSERGGTPDIPPFSLLTKRIATNLIRSQYVHTVRNL